MAKFDIERELNKIQSPVIYFDNVSKCYQKNCEALGGVTFNITKGEFVFLVGDSGSGKTTVLKLMLKDTLPTKGRVYVAGHETKRLSRSAVANFRRGIGVVFQDFRLLNDRNVYENVAFAQRVIEADSKNIQYNVMRVLNLVGLIDKSENYPGELSGGQQQRVAIARALVNNPLILLADEPTGNLDSTSSKEIMHLLDNINKRGTTVVMVTHNLDIVHEMQKRVITLNHGKIVSDVSKNGYNSFSEAEDT